MSQELPIEYGGTGASTAEGARTNLGALSSGEVLAPNIIKTSQLVVEGTTGGPLISVVPTLYLSGSSPALGWFVDDDVTLQLDANDNIETVSGTGNLYYEFDIASGLTLASYFYSIMFDDGSEFTQTYGDGANGIVLTEPVVGTGRLTIDPTVIPFKVGVVSELVGRGAVLSVGGVIGNASTIVDYDLSPNGYIIYANGYVEQWGSLITSSAALALVNVPIVIPLTTVLSCDGCGAANGSNNDSTAGGAVVANAAKVWSAATSGTIAVQWTVRGVL